MPVAAPTIDRMENKVTLETLAVNMGTLTVTMETLGRNVEQLAIITREGFRVADAKFEVIYDKFDQVDQRFRSLEENMATGFRTLRERADRVEYAVYQIQKDMDQLDQEMKGIHHVLDKFDGRITRIENHLELVPENP